MRNATEMISDEERHLTLKAHKMGNKALTVATLALVIVNLIFSLPYSPFIIVLMSSRIVNSVYLIIKKSNKKEAIWLVIWLGLMAKSLHSYIAYLISL